MVLILDDFFQVDKCGANFFDTCFFIIIFVIPLHCQIETETGSAGEQPARDTAYFVHSTSIFDLHGM